MKEEPLSSLKFPHFGEDGAAGSIYFSWRRNPFSPEDENSSSSSSSSSNSNSKSTSNSPSRSLPSSNLINVVSATWNKNEEDERKELQIIEEKLAREKKGEKGKEKESIFMDEKERVGLVQVNVLSTEASVTLEILEPVLNRIRHLVIATFVFLLSPFSPLFSFLQNLINNINRRGGSGSDWGYGIGAVPIGTTSRFAVIRSNGLIHLFEVTLFPSSLFLFFSFSLFVSALFSFFSPHSPPIERLKQSQSRLRTSAETIRKKIGTQVPPQPRIRRPRPTRRI